MVSFPILRRICTFFTDHIGLRLPYLINRERERGRDLSLLSPLFSPFSSFFSSLSSILSSLSFSLDASPSVYSRLLLQCFFGTRFLAFDFNIRIICVYIVRVILFLLFFIQVYQNKVNISRVLRII